MILIMMKMMIIVDVDETVDIIMMMKIITMYANDENKEVCLIGSLQFWCFVLFGAS